MAQTFAAYLHSLNFSSKVLSELYFYRHFYKECVVFSGSQEYKGDKLLLVSKLDPHVRISIPHSYEHASDSGSCVISLEQWGF